MNKILDTLIKTGAILEGHFLLTSGLHSDKYVEKFRLIENPESLNFVCSSMANIYRDQKINVVLGAAIGGILLSSGVAKHIGKKGIFTERVKEKPSLQKQVESREGQQWEGDTYTGRGPVESSDNFTSRSVVKGFSADDWEKQEDLIARETGGYRTGEWGSDLRRAEKEGREIEGVEKASGRFGRPRLINRERARFDVSDDKYSADIIYPTIPSEKNLMKVGKKQEAIVSGESKRKVNF